MSNCLFEATLQQIESNCNCTPKYYLDVVQGFNACEGTQRKCMNDLLLEIGRQKTFYDKGVKKVTHLTKERVI